MIQKESFINEMPLAALEVRSSPWVYPWMVQQKKQDASSRVQCTGKESQNKVKKGFKDQAEGELQTGRH